MITQDWTTPTDDAQTDKIATAFAGFAEVYGGAVLSVRRAATVDGYVLNALGTLAIIAATGPTSSALKVAAAQLLSAAAHVARVEAQFAAREAAQADQAGAQATPAHVMDATEAAVREEGAQAARQAPGLGEAPPAGAEAVRAAVLADTDPEAGYVAHADDDHALDADEAMAPDEDLHRWILDPGADVWGDLLDAPGPDKPATDRVPRPGVTQDMVQARFDRVHAFLDVSTPPAGVDKAAWEAAKARALPALHPLA